MTVLVTEQTAITDEEEGDENDDKGKNNDNNNDGGDEEGRQRYKIIGPIGKRKRVAV